MQIISFTKLTEKLDKLDHAVRVQTMAQLGKDHMGSTELNALLSQFWEKDDYYRYLSLFSYAASRQAEKVISALDSQSLIVQSTAISLFYCYQESPLLEQWVLSTTPQTRKLLLQKIRQYKKSNLTERLLDKIVQKFGPQHAMQLLPVCQDATIQHFLQAFGRRIFNWRPLAHVHPDIVLQYIRNEFAACSTRNRTWLWSGFASALRPLAFRRPEQLVQLINDFTPSDQLPAVVQSQFGILMKRVKDQLFKLLTKKEILAFLKKFGLPTLVTKYFNLFSQSQKQYFIDVFRQQLDKLEPLYEKLPPSQRELYFMTSYRHSDIDNFQWPLGLLAVFPHALRHRLSQSMLKFHQLTLNKNQKLGILACMDIDSVRTELENEAKAAKADDRAKGLSLLIICCGRYRKGLQTTLQFLQRIKNEQDPVREAAFSGLSRIPPSLFEEQHADLLLQLADYAMDARDTSYATRSSIRTLSLNLIRTFAATPKNRLFRCALAMQGKLAGQTQELTLPPLDNNLPSHCYNEMMQVFEPILKNANRRENHQMTVAIARSFGRKAWDLDTLQRLLESIIDAKPDYNARQALELWLANPKTRDQRIKKLLQWDRSVIISPLVHKHLHQKRQSWLDPYLCGKPIQGRFLTGKTVYLLPVDSRFVRWLPRQQVAYSSLLESVIKDKKRSQMERTRAIRVLANIPCNSIELFKKYLSSEEVPIQEAALAATAWLDRIGATLPVLLQHMDSDRARIAMYAMLRCARLVPAIELSATLVSILSDEKAKITVQKETIRLLGQFPTDEGMQLIKQLAAKETIHRDVAIAVGHAARSQMDSIEEVWPILLEMTASTNPHVVESLLDQQSHWLSQKTRLRYAGLILTIAQHPISHIRRAAFAKMTGLWSEGCEADLAKIACANILDLAKTELRPAMDALVSCCQHAAVQQSIIELTQELVHLQQKDLQLQDRDLPYLQRLNRLCDSIFQAKFEIHRSLLSTLVKMDEICNTDPLLWEQCLKLKVAAIDFSSFDSWQESLLSLDPVLTARPEWFDHFLILHLSCLQPYEPNMDSREIPDFIHKLAGSKQLSLALIALQLTQSWGSNAKWPKIYRQLLTKFRQYDHPWVRIKAREIFMVNEVH